MYVADEFELAGLDIKFAENYDLEDVVTPIDVSRLEELLREVEYPPEETQYLCDGFRNGFDLGYRGPVNRQDLSDNIPITVGSPIEMWNKVMDEVSLGRFTGPFERMPYSKTYLQSPIGLVPKDENKTRLIFHLSYTFKNGNGSINHWTPPGMCSVNYNDLDHAVRNCLYLMQDLGIQVIYFAKSDLKSVFRILSILPWQRCYLVLNAKHPITGKVYFFVDKCLPFGASISCSHFQRFSNALRSIVERISNRIRRTLITNYLDDFLFVYFQIQGCNEIVVLFLRICGEINFPVALDKTEWASLRMIFLGMLLDGTNHTLSISLERWKEILHMVKVFQHKKSATVKELQKLAGHLICTWTNIHQENVCEIQWRSGDNKDRIPS